MTESVIFKTRSDARVAPAAPPSPDRPRRRKPLGLAPGVDAPAADARPPAASEDRFAQYDDPAIGLVVESNELLLGVVKDMQRHFELKIVKLEALLNKVIGEAEALKLIVEHARSASRGEAGCPGPRGVGGRDGAQGATGPQGPPGPRGAAAPAIASWEIDDSAFVAYPLLSNGHKGPGLHLRGMFEVYNQQVDASDATAEIDAAASSRARAEQDLASHWMK